MYLGLAVLSPLAGLAQERGDSLGVRPDSLVVPTDSLVTPADSLATQPTGSNSQLTEPVAFEASDSLIAHIRGLNRIATLHGNAGVSYSGSTLSAHEIDLLLELDELHARGARVDTGWVGRPEFTQGSDVFLGDELAFNLRTRRGRVVGGQTRFEEGFVRSGVLKAVEDSVTYIQDGVYTTCECIEDPSYSLRSNKMKLVGREWIYTGPIQLYLYNIPTPLWLPFGFLPAREGRRSGPLPPTYGEDEFGFYLRDWGWYFAMNDYMDLQLQGGFWTRGSWEVGSLYRYNKRYGFNGQVGIDYARFASGEPGDPTYAIRQTGAFRWDHTQTIGRSADLRGDVNLSSSSYLRAVSQDYDDRVRQDLRSSFRFSQRWSQQSLTAQISQRQQLATGEVSLTLPNISYSRNSFKPFEREVRPPGSTERFYEKITIRYSATVNNQFDYRPLDDEDLLAMGDTAAVDLNWWDALTSARDYRRRTGENEPFQFRTSHSIPIGASFNMREVPLLGRMDVILSPSFQYTEDWLVRTERRSLTPDSSEIQTESVPGFFAVRQYSTGISANTTFYGLLPFSGFGYEGIRHTVRPSLSYSYRPDFYSGRWGYTRTYTDSSGEEVRYAIAPGVGRGLQRTLGFSLENTFHTRRREDLDNPTRTGSGPTKLLDLTMRSTYNLAADSLRMSPILLTARTNVLGKVNVDFRSTFSPYETNANGRVVEKSAFRISQPLGRLTSAELTLRTSLRSSTGAGDRPLTSPRAGFTGEVNQFGEPSGMFEQNLGIPQTDFSIPWSLSLDVTYGVMRSGIVSSRRATANSTFDFSLTPNWKVSGRTGYDFENKEMVLTSLAIARDFECWQMSFNWTPFGAYASWGFDLHVKSSHLKDLLRIRQPKSDVQDRFGGLLN